MRHDETWISQLYVFFGEFFKLANQIFSTFGQTHGPKISEIGDSLSKKIQDPGQLPLYPYTYSRFRVMSGILGDISRCSDTPHPGTITYPTDRKKGTSSTQICRTSGGYVHSIGGEKHPNFVLELNQHQIYYRYVFFSFNDTVYFHRISLLFLTLAVQDRSA